MKFVLILLILISGCTKNFKTNYQSNNAIVIEELEPIQKDDSTSKLEDIKLEMQERLKKIKNE